MLRVVVLVVVVLTAGNARAEEGPYSNFLVGERALGLGGAFVAVADDASAVFHNPGGVGNLSTESVSGSMWALSFSARKLESGYTTDIGAAQLDHDDVPSLPLFLAGVFKFGKRDVDGVRRHGLGAILFSPRAYNYTYLAQIEAAAPMADPAGIDRLEVRHTDEGRWVGIAYGYRLTRMRLANPRWDARRGFSLGLSTFLASRAISHQEVEIRTREGTLADLPPNALNVRDSTLRANARHLVLRLGGIVDWNRHWRFGAMFQPPGIRVDGEGRTSELFSTVDGAGTQFTTDRADGLRSNVSLPWEIRLGATWLTKPETLLTLDASMLGPAGGTNEPLPLVETRTNDPFPGVFVPARTAREVSLRGALGFELLAWDLFPIRGGLLAELSSSPAIPDKSPVYLREDINTFGAALSFGVRTEGYDISVGASALYGVGTGLAVRRSAVDAVPSYDATNISEQTVFLFVSGGMRAVGQLVEYIEEEAGDKKRPRR
jgi:hypothetical protein